MPLVRAFFYFNVDYQLWVGYCIEYDVEAMAGAVVIAWPKLVTVCNEYLDLCFETGRNEIRIDENINAYFHNSKKELMGRRELDWGVRLEGYKLVA